MTPTPPYTPSPIVIIKYTGTYQTRGHAATNGCASIEEAENASTASANGTYNSLPGFEEKIKAGAVRSLVVSGLGPLPPSNGPATSMGSGVFEFDNGVKGTISITAVTRALFFPSPSPTPSPTPVGSLTPPAPTAAPTDVRPTATPSGAQTP
ncbi:MAG TPA: hypothetical protein VGD50_06205 [Candidatus Baltobacteraceae bacterium]